jgi:TRAP-type C4-dicarboxylate transport system permease small subunit
MSEGLPVRDDMPADATGRVLELLARASAIFGGLVLTAAMLMTVLSVIGRALVNVVGGVPGFGWMGPVPGDYEIVELAAAVGVAAFLPMCQMRGGHVLVDMFFARSGPRALSGFSALSNLLFVIAGGVIVWRLYLGTISKFQYQESSMVLQIPVGWGYLGLTIFFAIAVLCAIYLLIRDVGAMMQAGGGTTT